LVLPYPDFSSVTVLRSPLHTGWHKHAPNLKAKILAIVIILSGLDFRRAFADAGFASA